MPPEEESLSKTSTTADDSTATEVATAIHNDVIIGPDLNPSRTPYDKKQYRQILLPNGLRVLLVSDVVAMTQAYNGGGLYNENTNCHDDESSVEDKNDGSSDEDEEEDDGEHGLRNAAAAMLVGVGSFFDPPECQGMAHFLEHLLFMGSKKYPEENAYDAFMSKHGGNDNAYTEMEHTVYHFEIPQEHLAAGLDIFAQFFIHPLMLESSVERELQAIESEFKLVKNADDTRVEQLMCHTCGYSVDEHPYSKFGWGNYKSLKEIPEQTNHDPLKLLRQFYDEHYHASNMRLVVVGGFTLDYLQEKVVKSFSDIRSKDILGSYSWDQTCQSPIKQYGLPFHSMSLEKVFYVAPVKDRHSLSVTWQIPSQIENWKSKPCDLIAHLIGHEGKGSLLASLKAMSWATACCAGVGDGGDENASSHALFRVTFSLSEVGIHHWRDVVSELYQYVGMLRYYCNRNGKEGVGLPIWIFEELKSIYKVAHRYADEEPPEDFAVDLAEDMSPWLNTPPERLLDASGLLFQYDPDTVLGLIDGHFRPSNARIDLASTYFGRSGNYEEESSTKKGDFNRFCLERDCLSPTDEFFDPSAAGPPNIEPFFGTPFWCQQLSSSQLEKWNALSAPQLPPTDSILDLPQKNAFVPTNFALKPLPPSDCDHPLLKCSIKLQISVGRKKQWFPATVTQYNGIKNEILCHYEDEHERWHQMDMKLSELTYSRLTSPTFEGTLDNKTIKYKILSLAMEGEKTSMKFGDESDFSVESGKIFPAIPPAALPSRLPKLIINNNELKFWHLQDRTYKRPIADLRLSLNCAEANKTALHGACADLLVNLVSDNLTEVAYMASICELGSTLSADDGGFAMRAHGFDDKLLDLFLIMLEAMLKFRNADLKELPEGFNKQNFDLILESYQRSCHNSGMKSQKLGSSVRVRCLRPGSYSARQKLKAIENIDVATFLSTISKVLNNIGAEGFYHGNIDLCNAEEAKTKILALLRQSSNSCNNEGLPKKKYPSQVVLKLPLKSYSLTCVAKDPTETNASVEAYFQVGKDNTFDRVMVDLLMEILYEPLYNQLRTKDQFGYSVSCDSRWTNGIIGMHFCVVTASKTIQETEDRIEQFLTEFRQTLERMSSEDFMEHAVGLAIEKLNMFHSLSEETDHFWSEIRDGRYKWEVEREEVICLKTITKEQTLKAYDQWLSPLNNKRKKLVVKVVASEGISSAGRPDINADDAEDFNDKCVDTYHAFCKHQTYGRIY